MGKRPPTQPASSEQSDETPESNVRYAPKRYTPSQELIFGAKLGLVVGALILLLWLLDKNA